MKSHVILTVAALGCAMSAAGTVRASAQEMAAQPTESAPAADSVEDMADMLAQPAEATANAPAQSSENAAETDIPQGKGKVVFFRKGGFVGSAISCAVHENGEKLTSLRPGRFAIVYAEPGIHEYMVKSEATDRLRLKIEAGETYYSKCNITMGVMAGRPNLSPSDQAAFDAMSAKLKPVEIKER